MSTMTTSTMSETMSDASMQLLTVTLNMGVLLFPISPLFLYFLIKNNFIVLLSHRHIQFSGDQYRGADQWGWCWRYLCWNNNEGVSEDLYAISQTVPDSLGLLALVCNILNHCTDLSLSLSLPFSTQWCSSSWWPYWTRWHVITGES